MSERTEGSESVRARARVCVCVRADKERGGESESERKRERERAGPLPPSVQPPKPVSRRDAGFAAPRGSAGIGVSLPVCGSVRIFD